MRFMRLRAPSVSDSCHSAASEAKDLFGLGCPSVRSFDGREPTKAPRGFEPLKQCLKCPSCDGQEDGKRTRTLITAAPKNGVRSLRVGLPCCLAIEWHRPLQAGVASLQFEMLLDRVCEQRFHLRLLRGGRRQRNQ